VLRLEPHQVGKEVLVMQARGPLMIEHRLIERMIALMQKEVERVRRDNNVDTIFIDTAVDFLRMYADKTHHGKEEDILFRDLARKNMSQQDANMMNDLIKEHVLSRKTVGELVKAKERYLAGDRSAFEAVAQGLSTLVQLYPKHIEKEDKIFFPAAMRYLSKAEQESMLTEFAEFDREMIHHRYKDVVEVLEG
jgi:hemerythrin-like domain-containing protein